MLYLGYVGFAVPFAFAIAALLEASTRAGCAGRGRGPTSPGAS
jgi:cytochrome c biogenesis factor